MGKRLLYFVMLTALLFANLNASAADYDFKVDGIRYNILSVKDRTVEVTNEYGGQINAPYPYRGDVLTIPAKVVYEYTTYTVVAIGNYAFQLTDLTTVELPGSVTTIKDYAFSWNQITSIELPVGVETIGNYAFYNSDINTIGISNSVTTIGNNAFNNCNSLTDVYIPGSVTYIGGGAFLYCDALTAINVDGSNQEYASKGGILYTKDMRRLICYPKGKLLNSYVIPEGVVSIEESAFLGCKLTSVDIPGSVKTIESSVWAECDNLDEVYCKATTPPSASYDAFGESTLKGILYVPAGSKAAYEAVDPWRNFWNIVEMDFGGVENEVAETGISVSTDGCSIIVNGEPEGRIEVYSINGQCVYNGTETTIENLAKGAYIVKVANQTFKVVI